MPAAPSVFNAIELGLNNEFGTLFAVDDWDDAGEED